MERDNQFEVQFLLSLMIVVLGVLASQQLSEFASIVVGGSFLLISSVHLLLISVHYSFNQVSKFEGSTIRGINRWSRRTLRLTTLAFLYMVFHILFSASNLTSIPAINWGPSVEQTIIAFGVPFLPVVLIYGAFRRKIRDTLRVSEDLSFTIVPEWLKVYHNPEETKPLRITVENSGEQTYDLDFEMTVPDPLLVKYDHEWQSGVIEESFELGPRSRKPLDFELKHESTTRKTILLKAQFTHGSDIHNETIECDLRL